MLVNICLKFLKNRADCKRIIIFVAKMYYMKRLLYILLLLTATFQAKAQSENGVKDFGGFILDMGTMLNAESLTVPPILLPTLSYQMDLGEASPRRVNADAFRLNPNVAYMGGTGMVNWQGASYKLDNGMRINLYGEYDADGRKVYNPSAMPWQKNNFNAAFEMKSANGNFGIKVEVHGGRNNPLSPLGR